MKQQQVESGASGTEQQDANWPDPKPSHQTRGLLSCALVLALLFLVFVASWALLSPSGRAGGGQAKANECELVDELTLLHFINQQQQIRVPSSDFKTLVKFVGSVRFTQDANESTSSDGQSLHLPLALKSVSIEQGHSLQRQRALVLVAGCGRLTLRLASDARQVVVTSIELETVRSWTVCVIDSTSISLHDFALNRYFACHRTSRRGGNDHQPPPAPMSYSCKWTSWTGPTTFVQREVAQLQVHALEFEFDGRPELIRQNIFSKPARSCGSDKSLQS